ncbi:MAG: ankyrin repeat domain-containing protein [bacterium]
MKKNLIVLSIIIVVGVGFYFGYQYSSRKKAEIGDASHLQTPANQLAEVDKPNKDGTTVLMNAAYSGNIDTVQRLLDKGATVNAKNKFEMTPLINAVSRPYSSGNAIEVVKLLIKNGADVNSKTKEGWTALHGAVQGEQTEAAIYLLENGAEIDSQYTLTGETPLMMATERVNKVLMQALLTKGADVNAKDKWGKGVISYAHGRPDLVEMLKQAGAK